MLADAALGVDPKSWTAQVLAFLRGQLDDKGLVAAAKDAGSRTEAHAYIGFMHLENGRHDAARTEFEWVRDNGLPNYSEYPLAIGQLRLLDKAASR